MTTPLAEAPDIDSSSHSTDACELDSEAGKPEHGGSDEGLNRWTFHRRDR